MNERIRELSKQAGLQPFEDCGPGYVHKMEKFADLIIRKCCEISDEAEQADLPVLASKFIKAHFGLDTQ